nr:alpha/beta hydrolase [candidate division Zixibacteria bacterium]
MFWIFGGLLLVGLLLYIIMAVLLMAFQARFVYFPSREIESTPETAGLVYEDITFKTRDGVELMGWFIHSRELSPVILFCHGNGGNISHRLQTLEIFHEMGLDCLIFDYRGYGQSGGEPSEVGTYLDAEAAWDFLIREKGFLPEQIIIHGRSLGGAVAANLASRIKPKALILESAFTSILDMGADMYPYLPVRLLSRFRYETARYVENISCPVLVIHSPDDDLIPFKHGQKIYEKTPEPKMFPEIYGDHNGGFLLDKDMYVSGISDFLEKTYQIK